MKPQLLFWFIAILLSCLNVSYISFVFLAPSCFLCPVGVHTVWQYPVKQLGHHRGLWAPSHAQENGKLTIMELWREETSSTELWLRSTGLCPSLRSGQNYHNTCKEQATSWGNLYTGRLKCSPEALMKSSGSPMTQKNPSAFNNDIDSLILVNHIAGGYSRYFCFQLSIQPFYTRSLSL